LPKNSIIRRILHDRAENTPEFGLFLVGLVEMTFLGHFAAITRSCASETRTAASITRIGAFWTRHAASAIL